MMVYQKTKKKIKYDNIAYVGYTTLDRLLLYIYIFSLALFYLTNVFFYTYVLSSDPLILLISFFISPTLSLLPLLTDFDFIPKLRGPNPVYRIV